MTIPRFSTPEAMRRLIEQAITNVGKSSNCPLPRWSHVGRLFGHGSGYSAAICKEFGFDPDELVGGLTDGKYCHGCGICQGCFRHYHEECSNDCEAEDIG